MRPRPHVSGYFWIRNFFSIRIRLSSTLIQRVFMRIHNFLNPLSRVDNFWIRKQFGTVWMGESGYFWIHWRGKVRSSLYWYKQIYCHMKKHLKQTLFMLKWVRSLHFDAKLIAFSTLTLLDVIDLEIYRKRLSELSTLAWGQRGISLIYRSFLARFLFVNIILYLILARVSLTGVLLLSRHVSFWTLLHCTNHF